VRLRLERIQKAAQRAAGLTQQMLAYAGRGPLVMEPLHVSQLVLEMGQLVESAVSGRAVLRFDMEADLPAVEGDATQISQVVLNLITNAAEAFSESSGTIRVRTGSIHSSQIRPGALFAGELREGRCVYFEVRDDGPGIAERDRARIFDPFFTTKFTGRGLGLAAVIGIVRGHGGAIEVESEVGRGTRFRVLLPAADRAPAASGARDPAAARRFRSGTVLVVDDDEGVRELAAEILRRAGLRVLSTRGGRDAVELFAQHAGEIDAVLLDRTMPLMSGEDTFDALRELRRDVRIVLMSGYSRERAVESFARRGLAGFLQKPFDPGELVAKLAEVLGK
jgi:CheY-like chemotaxis protein